MKRKRNLSKWASKKAVANLEPFLILLIGIFTFAVISLIGFFVFNSLNTDLQLDSEMNPVAKENSSSLFARYDDTIDGAFITIFVLCWIVALVAGWTADEHPLFLIVTIFVMIMLLVCAALFSNVWEDFATDDDLYTFADSLSFTSLILENLLLVSVSVIGSVLAIIFMKSRVT